MADFNGSSGDDIFTGGADADTAYGNGGNDMLSGSSGNDKLYGGAGADTLDGGANDDILISYDASNVFYAYSNMVSLDVGIEHDVLSGGDGDDILAAGYGDDVSGGSGYNKLFINFLGATSGVYADFRLQQSGGSIVIGGGTISGITQTSDIQGSNYDDTIYSIGSYYGFSTLHGNGGNDQLFADYYTNAMYGDDGNDIVDGRASQYLSRVEGGVGDDTLYTPTNSFAAAYGGDGNDTIYSHGATYGGNGNDLIILQSSYYGGQVLGEAGDDDIRASTSGHLIAGGSGADILTGNSVSDQLYSADLVANSNSPADDMGLEHDQLSGGGGDDTLGIGYGDDANGGAGNDTLRLSLGGLAGGIAFSTAGIVSAQPFVLGGGTIQNIEILVYLRGTNFADTLTLATQGTLLTVDAGDGDDVIISFNSSVAVAGGNGNDRFISGAAGDTLDGGAGIDTIDYVNAAAGVTVTLAAVAGQTGSGAGGDQLKYIENIGGSSYGDTLNGSDDANLIYGMAGNDTINGKGGADIIIGGDGLDQLYGGAGNDTFYIDDASGDIATELAAEGSDRIYVALSYALAGGSEIEVLSTNDYASTAAINLTGNGIGQTLIGNAGENVLHGGGGTDLLIGLGGRDTYYVDVASTQIVEYEGGGNDALYVSVSYTLVNGEVETLSANNYLSTQALNLTGNLYGQTVIGNAGANVLNGGGGTDLLIGLGANDTYYVDVAATQIVEYEGGGNDAVYVSLSYTLGGSAEVETLSANNYSSTQAINLTGNLYAQTIVGNAGANILHGGGGVDTLMGLGGNDIYYVDVLGTQVSEIGGAGTDAIYTSVSFALAAGNEIETLSSNDYGATTAIGLTGNAFAQVLVGNAGANMLDGGAGADTLYGFGGADSFQFTSALGGGNVDTITDFSVVDDTIALDDAVFAAAGGLGALDANAFHTGSAAHDADDRIIYNSATGQLFYDADGTGGIAAVQFATLANGLNLTASDFQVI